MAVKCRFVDYYAVKLADRPGTGAKALGVLKRARVGLDAVHAFPEGRGCQMDLVPSRSRTSPRKWGCWSAVPRS